MTLFNLEGHFFYRITIDKDLHAVIPGVHFIFQVLQVKFDIGIGIIAVGHDLAAILERFSIPEPAGKHGGPFFDLVGFDRTRLGRDALLGVALIPACLVFILGGNYAAGWLWYGTLTPAYLFGPLPLPAALYGVLVFPFIWGFTEQVTYNGYLLPRFQVLSRNTVLAVAVVAFVWSLQHAFMPLTFEADFMAFRALSSVPHSVFITLLYLRLRRLLPLAIAHALMDGASVFIGVLLPVLRS